MRNNPIFDEHRRGIAEVHAENVRKMRKQALKVGAFALIVNAALFGGAVFFVLFMLRAFGVI